MNVTCPECATVYRVDPVRVPEGGVEAQCARCPGIFRVSVVGAVEDQSGEDPAPQGEGVAPPYAERSVGEAYAAAADPGEQAPVSVSLAEPGERERAAQSEDERSVFSTEQFDADAVGDLDGELGDPSNQGTYAGATDVTFHTEEAGPDDLPYLRNWSAPASSESGRSEREGEPPEIATHGTAESDGEMKSPSPSFGEGQTFSSGPGQSDAIDVGEREPFSPSGPTEADSAAAGPFDRDEAAGEAVASAERDIASDSDENPDASGEAPLPPPPFGALSDPHRRATRLARALVSDIVVYHPDRRARSLRQGTLRQEFREEIRKSWEEYANQVGGEFARQTTYFRDALNEILADGATVF